MGCPIRTIVGLLDSLDEARKDWCIVLLLDRDRPTVAGSQMRELLSDFDEDSGDVFDFYLPGYSVEPIAPDGGDTRQLFQGMRLANVNVAVIDRLGELNFSCGDFRTFYKKLESFAPYRWRWQGGCELILFRRNCGYARDRDPLLNPRGCHSQSEIVEFGAYNLEDIVLNRFHTQQFVRQLCNILERTESLDGGLDWLTVKRAVDDLYSKMIIPAPDASLSTEQIKMLDAGARFVASRFGEQGYVFISHSTKDVEFALSVRDALENRGVKCWMAPRDIPGGTNYAYMISGTLKKCGMLLFLLSQNSMDSVWCTKEMLFRFSDLQREGRIYVAWCRQPIMLRQGYDFTLNNVQIDGSRDVSQITRSVVSSFFGQGLANARATETRGWINALLADRQLANTAAFVDNCPWDRFSGHDWIAVLTEYYDLNERIRFNLLSADDSALVIAHFPLLADRCDWDRIARDFPWGQVRKHPELIKNFPVETAGTSAWVNLLRACPEAPHVNWERLNDLLSGSDWVKLIVAQPSLAEKFQHWNQLSGENWNFLLSRRPEIAKFCDAVNGWAKLNAAEWAHVIKHVPDFARRRS